MTSSRLMSRPIRFPLPRTLPGGPRWKLDDRERSFAQRDGGEAVVAGRDRNACRVYGYVTPGSVRVIFMDVRIGYARVSTRHDQHPEAQHDALRVAGCDRVYVDTASGKLARRPELDKALVAARHGDQLVVTKLDRLGRSLEHLIDCLLYTSDAADEEDSVDLG